MSAAQEITRHYGGDWHGTYGSFPAPGHSKSDRGVTVKDAPGGDVLINSFNGADWRKIKDEIRRVGLLPEREPRANNGEGPRETGWYEYADASGAVVYRTVRVEQVGRKKRFKAQRPDGRGGWINGLDDIERVPYRLPDILAADSGEPVYLVEGERKADKLASWGFVATAVAFGCKGWRECYAAALAGRHVIILPDNDDEGRGFAQRAAKDIEGQNGTAQIVALPGLPPAGDIMDWTGSADDLRALVATVASPAADNEPDADWPSLDLLACAATKAPAREWLIDGWIPANKATLLAGDGGVGKSLLAQIKATCVAFGRPFMGMNTRQGNAAYLSWEDDSEELWRRQEAICAAMGIPMASLAGRLHLVSYTLEENPFLVTADDSGLRVMPLGRKLERLVDRHRIGLLILDNASQIAGINHNAVEEVAPFAHWLGTLATRNSGAVVLLHHTNKVGQDFLGSVAYNNQFRSRMLLARPEGCHDPDLRILTNPKANYAQAGNGIEVRWFKGAFVRDDDLSEDMRAEIAATAAAASDNAAFLACLVARERDGLIVSPNVSPNYAPTQFEAMPKAKGIGRDRLRAAMERLLTLGAIEVYDHENKDKRRTVKAIRLASRTSPDAPPDVSRTGSRTFPAPDPNGPRTPPHTHPSPKGEEGAAHEAAAPSPEMDDGLDANGNIIGWDDDRRGYQ